MVLASTFNGYEFVIDQRQLTRRTDAVYQAEGPPPPFDVAEGAVTEEGAEDLDPTGERRRWGRVVTIAHLHSSPIRELDALLDRFDLTQDERARLRA
jgi:hypothetical protein